MTPHCTLATHEPPLIQLLQDDDPGVRWTVSDALGDLGDRQAVPSLIPLLEDQNCGVRQLVCLALGRLGDGRAIIPLRSMLTDDFPIVRWYAVQALGTLGTSEVIVDIQRMLADPDAALVHSRTASLRFFRSAGGGKTSTAKEKVARDVVPRAPDFAT